MAVTGSWYIRDRTADLVVTCRSLPVLLFTCNGGNSIELLSWTPQRDENNSKLIIFLES
jgi:hypothetical protein